MNECDIAETCTGDSSQVRPAPPSCGALGEATPTLVDLVFPGECSALPSSPQLASTPSDQTQFSYLRKGFFMLLALFLQSLNQNVSSDWYSQRLARCLV